MEEILTDPDNLTAKKISQKLKIPLATVYRQLEILCEERFLIQNVNKTFIPGPKIREIILPISYGPYQPSLLSFEPLFLIHTLGLLFEVLEALHAA